MTVYRVVFYIISSRFKIWWRFYVAMVKIAFCLELIKFGQIVKGSIFKLGKTKFDLCVLIWFLIFCYVKVFVIVDQLLIFWQCLTILHLSVVENINGVCKFLLLYFYGVLLLTFCVWNYACLRQKKRSLLLFKWRTFFQSIKIYIWLYELLS